MADVYHIEMPFVGPVSVLESLRDADTIVGLQTTNRRQLSYTDNYWDTERLDLHAAAIAVRSRRRGHEDDFITFKGPPTYLAPFVFGRPLVSESVDGAADARDRISLRTPSQAMTGLYGTRPDLVGRALEEVATAVVDRVNVDLIDQSGDGVCTMSFHSYKLTARTVNAQAGLLLELQPYCKSPVVSEALLKLFRIIVPRLEQSGLRPSPVGKYHRIPRIALEQ